MQDTFFDVVEKFIKAFMDDFLVLWSFIWSMSEKRGYRTEAVCRDKSSSELIEMQLYGD